MPTINSIKPLVVHALLLSLYDTLTQNYDAVNQGLQPGHGKFPWSSTDLNADSFQSVPTIETAPSLDTIAWVCTSSLQTLSLPRFLEHARRESQALATPRMLTADSGQELQLMILHRVPDTTTLLALVHASPLFYRYYRVHREELYTHTTINQLLTRGINILFGTAHETVIEVYGQSWSDELRHALVVLHGQMESMNPAKPLKLNMDDCKMLLSIADIHTWELFQDEHGHFRVRRSLWRETGSQEKPCVTECGWTEGGPSLVVSFGEYEHLGYLMVPLIRGEEQIESNPEIPTCREFVVACMEKNSDELKDELLRVRK